MNMAYLFIIGSRADFPTAERAKWAGLLAYSAHWERRWWPAPFFCWGCRRIHPL